ncbi:putative Woronin body protein HexA [Aspergillus aculeatinus CBS 121060]|uniref:Woronin body major protein n=1 Tax=Aspergillus aculeatinus CBS 121060 TaxID=1448322 RepID=A0ACD1HDZ3_9EURO|nr:woronin body major protein [Aspergillus aculeatinus CBS 121060]RAH71685.1 woronin body major protein [Aspergillus aculeatinus CBS 121060]
MRPGETGPVAMGTRRWLASLVVYQRGRDKLWDSRKDADRTANLDFDARVPIPFSVFPSSYRSDAVPEATLAATARVEEEVNLDRTSHVEREDTRTSAPLPDPRVYGKEEIDLHFVERDQFTPAAPEPHRHEHHHHRHSSRPNDVSVHFDERVTTTTSTAPPPRYPEVDLTRERYREPSVRFQDRQPTYDQALQTQLDITEREYRRRVNNPTYDVNPAYNRSTQAPVVDSYAPGPRQPTRDVSYDRTVQSEIDVSYDRAYQSKPVDSYQRDPYSRRQQRVEPVPQAPASSANVKVYKPKTVVDSPPSRKMGYYDDDGNYHSFRRGVERVADRIMHPTSSHHHHHGHKDHEELVVADERGPVRFREGVREDVRIVEPRAGNSSATAETVPIPVHFIRIGDILILQGRPCQVIRISVSPQTGQHRYLGVDLFTRELQEESSFVSNPSPSVVVQTMLGPVYKTYRILDLRDDGRLVAMTETGDVKQGLPVVPQGHLFRRIREAFEDGRGSVRALVINDGGRELVVDYKVVHASRL